MLPLFWLDWGVPEDGFAIAVAPPDSVGRPRFRSDLVTRAEWAENATKPGVRVLIPRTPAKTRFYEPLFGQPGLFLRFAELEQSEQAYIEFANHFGPPRHPSVYVVPPWNPEKLQSVPADFSTTVHDAFIAGTSLDWDFDIGQIAGVLRLHDAIAACDLEAIGELLIEHGRTDRAAQEDPLKVAEELRDQGITNGLGLLPDHDPTVGVRMVGGELCMFPTNLLGAMWLQCAISVEEGKQFRKCPARNCPKVWFEVSTGPQGVRTDAEFCSARCRHTAYRDRKTSARQMHRDGISVSKIAKTLKTDVRRVRAWLGKKRR